MEFWNICAQKLLTHKFVYEFVCMQIHMYEFVCMQIHMYEFVCMQIHMYEFMCMQIHADCMPFHSYPNNVCVRKFMEFVFVYICVK